MQVRPKAAAKICALSKYSQASEAKLQLAHVASQAVQEKPKEATCSEGKEAATCATVCEGATHDQEDGNRRLGVAWCFGALFQLLARPSEDCWLKLWPKTSGAASASPSRTAEAEPFSSFGDPWQGLSSFIAQLGSEAGRNFTSRGGPLASGPGPAASASLGTGAGGAGGAGGSGGAGGARRNWAGAEPGGAAVCTRCFGGFQQPSVQALLQLPSVHGFRSACLDVQTPLHVSCFFGSSTVPSDTEGQ